MIIHTVFDILAWLAAFAATLAQSRSGWMKSAATTPLSPDYLAALVIGSALGAYLFGSANLWLSGQPGIGRSIEGALAGAIFGVEVFKAARGIRIRTGARFALPVAVGIAVGRIGCFLSGLDDFTHGTPTTLPWGHDFGDGIPRHPVQLYESIAMALWAGVLVLLILRRPTFATTAGFHLTVAFYAAQRFIWEFWKPYGLLIGPFTLFHLLSAALFIYALVWLRPALKEIA